jgi:hypothetical protein
MRVKQRKMVYRTNKIAISKQILQKSGLLFTELLSFLFIPVLFLFCKMSYAWLPSF